MTTPEERLAELGLDAARGRDAAGGVRARRAHRQPRVHRRPAADADGRADHHRQGRRRGRRRGGGRVRAAVRAQRARRGQGRGRRPGRRQAGRQGRRASWHRRPTSPAQPQVANGACELLGEVFGDAGGTRARAVGVAGAAAGRAGRGRARSSRSEAVRVADAAAAAGRARRDRPARTPTGTAHAGRARGRRDRRAAARRSTAGPRSTCCAGRRSMAFAGGMCVFPGGGVDPRDFDADVALGRAGAGGVGGAARLRRGAGAGAGLRGRARDLRGVRRAAGRAGRPTRSSPTPPATTGRPTGVALEARDALARRLPRPARAGAAHRPARRLGALDHAGVRAAPLRHLVLRGALPEGQRDPRRVERVRRGRLAARAARPSTQVEAGELGMMPPTYLTCCEVVGVRRARRRARRGRGRDRSRCSRPTVVEDDGGSTLVDAGRARAVLASERPRVTAGPAARSATRGTCVLAPNPGPMTLDGTNTWVLREPGRRRGRCVVDPGPLDDGAPRRRRPTRPATWRRCCSPTATPTTPRRRAAFAERIGLRRPRARPGVPARRRGARRRRRGRGRRPRAARRRAPRATPPTRCRFAAARPTGRVLTGDTVLGRGTTVVAHPDGQLGRLPRLAATGCTPSPRRTRSTPSGPGTARCSTTPLARSTTTSPTAASGSTRSARPLRALERPARRRPAARRSSRSSTPTSTVLWGAAELSVRAQLDYLRD